MVLFDKDSERFVCQQHRLVPRKAFTHWPQSGELERAFAGAYLFAPIVATSRLSVSRLYLVAESSQAEA